MIDKTNSLLLFIPSFPSTPSNQTLLGLGQFQRTNQLRPRITDVFTSAAFVANNPHQNILTSIVTDRTERDRQYFDKPIQARYANLLVDESTDFAHTKQIFSSTDPQRSLLSISYSQHQSIIDFADHQSIDFSSQVCQVLASGKQLPVTALAKFLKEDIQTRLVYNGDNAQVQIQLKSDLWVDLSRFTRCFNFSEFIACEKIEQLYEKNFSPEAKIRGDYAFNLDMKYQNQDYWRSRLGPPRKILSAQDEISFKNALFDEDHEFKNLDMTDGHMFGNKEWSEYLPDLKCFADLNALEEYTGHDSRVMNPFFVISDTKSSHFKASKLKDPQQVKMALIKAIMVNSGINTMKAFNLLNQLSMKKTGTMANGKIIDPQDIPKNALLQHSDLFGAQAPLPEESGKLITPPFVSMSDSFLVAKRFMSEKSVMYRLLNDETHVAIFPVSRMPSEREYILQQDADFNIRTTPTEWATAFRKIYPEISLVEIEPVSKNPKTPIYNLDLQAQYNQRPWIIERMKVLAEHFDRMDLLEIINNQIKEPHLTTDTHP